MQQKIPPATIKDATEQLLNILLSNVTYVGLPELERELRFAIITAVIRRNGGNLCRAAKSLGVHRNTINREVLQMRALRRPDPVKLARLEKKNVQSQKKLNFQRMAG